MYIKISLVFLDQNEALMCFSINFKTFNSSMLGILEVLKCGVELLRLVSQYQGVRNFWCL